MARRECSHRYRFSSLSFLLLIWLVLSHGQADSAPILRAEPDELWSVTFDEKEVSGKWRVTFGRTGYFVVEKYEPTKIIHRVLDEKGQPGEVLKEEEESHWKALMDGGVCFYKAGYAESAYQKRTLTKHVKSSVDVASGTLKFESTLDFWQVVQPSTGEAKMQPRFHFIEKVKVQPRGLDFEYELTAADGLVAEQLGPYFHLPFERFSERIVRLYPDFSRCVLPKRITDGFLMDSRGHTLVVSPETGWEITISAREPLRFVVNDHRLHKLNVYRILGDILPSRTPISKDAKLKIAFSVRLGARKDDTSTQETLTRLASERCAPLPEDRETQGAWLGRYGSYGSVLCGLTGPSTTPIEEGHGFQPLALPYTFYSSNLDDPARIWMTFNERDKRVLWEPRKWKARVPGVWDDHGEVYPIGQNGQGGPGPNLYVDMEIPDGLFIVSFYFFDIDWIQHRRLPVNVRERTWNHWENRNRQKGKLLAGAEVCDILNGVYLRFLIRGPLPIQVEIERKNSPNACVSGVFYDTCLKPIPQLVCAKEVYEDQDPLLKFEDIYKRLEQVRESFLTAANKSSTKETLDALLAVRVSLSSVNREEAVERLDQISRAEWAYLQAISTPWEISHIFATLQDYASAVRMTLPPEKSLQTLDRLMRLLLIEKRYRESSMLCDEYVGSAQACPSIKTAQKMLSLAKEFLLRRPIPNGWPKEVSLSLFPQYQAAGKLLEAHWAMILAVKGKAEALALVQLEIDAASKSQNNQISRFLMEKKRADYGDTTLTNKEKWHIARMMALDEDGFVGARVMGDLVKQGVFPDALPKEHYLYHAFMVANNHKELDVANDMVDRLVKDYPNYEGTPIAVYLLAHRFHISRLYDKADALISVFKRKFPEHKWFPTVQKLNAELDEARLSLKSTDAQK